jgi:hypothetical protein
MEGDDVSPTFLFSLTASSGSEWAESTPALGRHGGLSFLTSVLCWMLVGKTGRWTKDGVDEEELARMMVKTHVETLHGQVER